MPHATDVAGRTVAKIGERTGGGRPCGDRLSSYGGQRSERMLKRLLSADCFNGPLKDDVEDPVYLPESRDSGGGGYRLRIPPLQDR